MLYQISKVESITRYKQPELIYAPNLEEALRIYKKLHTVRNEKTLYVKEITTYGALRGERGEVHINNYIYHTNLKEVT